MTACELLNDFSFDKLNILMGGDDLQAHKMFMDEIPEGLSKDKLLFLHLVSFFFERGLTSHNSLKFIADEYRIDPSNVPCGLPKPQLLFFLQQYSELVRVCTKLPVILPNIAVIFSQLDPRISMKFLLLIFERVPLMSPLISDFIDESLVYLKNTEPDQDAEVTLNKILINYVAAYEKKEKLRLIIAQILKRMPQQTLSSYIAYLQTNKTIETPLKYIFNSIYCPKMTKEDLISIFAYFATGLYDFRSPLFDSLIYHLARFYSAPLFDGAEVTSQYVVKLLNHMESVVPGIVGQLRVIVKAAITKQTLPVFAVDVFFSSFDESDLRIISDNAINSKHFVSYLQVFLKHIKAGDQPLCHGLFAFLVCNYFVSIPQHMFQFEWLALALLKLTKFYFVEHIALRVLDLTNRNAELAYKILAHCAKYEKSLLIHHVLIQLAIKKDIEALHQYQDILKENSGLTAEALCHIYASDLVKEESRKKDINVALTSIEILLNKEDVLQHANLPKCVKEALAANSKVSLIETLRNEKPENLRLSTSAITQRRELLADFPIVAEEPTADVTEIDPFLLEFTEAQYEPKKSRYEEDELASYFELKKEVVVENHGILGRIQGLFSSQG